MTTTGHSTDPAGAPDGPGGTSDAVRAVRAPGETSDSPQRPPQRMHGTALAFDLEAQSDLLRQEASWQRGDRNAKTLVKEEGFRVVLVVYHPGGIFRYCGCLSPLVFHPAIHGSPRKADCRPP